MDSFLDTTRAVRLMGVTITVKMKQILSADVMGEIWWHKNMSDTFSWKDLSHGVSYVGHDFLKREPYFNKM